MILGILTSRLQAGTTNQETINVGLLAELAAVLLVDAATVQDTGLLSNLVADLALEVTTDGGMGILSLLRSGNLAGTNGPDGLVRDDNVLPAAGTNLGLEGLKLSGDNLDRLVALALLERLTAAPDDLQAVVDGVLGFGGNDLVRLAQDGAALGVAKDDPVNSEILELGDRGLTSVCTISLVEDVLGGNLDLLLGQGAGVGEVDVGRRDDNL